MKSINLVIAAVLAACSFAACKANAATVTLDYGRDLGGGVQITGKAIDQSTVGLRLDAPAGRLAWGWELQVTQTGRAGSVYALGAGHVGYPVHLGKATVTPALEVGYALDLNDVYAFAGARADVGYTWNSKLSSEGFVRVRHSIPGTVNATPLNASDLGHDAVDELRVEVRPVVLHLGPAFEVGVRGAHVMGSGQKVPVAGSTGFSGIAPSYNVVGFFTRVTF